MSRRGPAVGRLPASEGQGFSLSFAEGGSGRSVNCTYGFRFRDGVVFYRTLAGYVETRSATTGILSSGFVAGAVLFGLFAIRTRTEEENLVARFGDGYRDYMKRTGRFLPRMTAK